MIIEDENLCILCFEKIEGEGDICDKCKGKRNNELYPTVLAEGTILNEKYIVGKVLGKGGFGITYLAYDPVYKTKVAIKEYFPDSLAHRDTGCTSLSLYTDGRYDDFKKGEDSFFNEAKTLSRLGYNENIVKVFEMFRENETSYYVMEYLEGMDLRCYLKSKGKLSEEKALEIMNPVFDAVAAVHKLDFLHRDISPDNILLCNDGRVKLIDFGSARQVMGQEAKTLTVMLKHGFAPFEQYKTHGEQGPWTDIYSLGATLYYIITGHVPLDAPSRMDNSELDMTGISDGISWLIRGMMNIHPEYRFRSISEVKNVLANAQAGGTGPAVQTGNVQNIPNSAPTGYANSMQGIPTSAPNTVYPNSAVQGVPVSAVPNSAVQNVPDSAVPYQNTYNYGPAPKQKKQMDKKKTKKTILICLGVIVGLIVAGSGISIITDPLGFKEFTLGMDYSYVGSYHEGYVVVGNDSKYGYANEEGELVIPLEYDSSNNFYDGVASVRKDGKYGYIDTKGDTVIDFIYDEAYNFSEGFAKVKKDDLWGAIDKNGKTVIDFRYTESYTMPYSLENVRKVNEEYLSVLSRHGIEEIDRKVYDDNNNSVIHDDGEGLVETLTYIYDDDMIVRYIDIMYFIRDYYPGVSSSKMMSILKETAAPYEKLSFCTVKYVEQDEYIAVVLDFEDLDKLENVSQMGDMITDGGKSLISKTKSEEGYKQNKYIFKFEEKE